jgi:outer membrane protein TolC
MKFKHLLLFTCLISLLKVNAQQKKALTLQEAIEIALTKGNNSKISNNNVIIAKEELKTTKSNIYPDFELSGQYQYLTNPDIDLQISGLDNSTSESSNVNKFLIGQATVTMPLFSGFKIKNLVKASENKYKASIFFDKSEKEQIALQIIKDYTDLYKSRKTILLIEENLVRAKQRVKDFTDMEKNGLLAKNDLLKAIIQESNIGISLEEANKNAYMLNYQLVTDLKLPENTKLSISGSEFEIVENLTNEDFLTDSIQRNDLKALQFEELAGENQIKATKSKYYPSISFVGGYTSLDINNLLTVTNAMNFGVGVSYNIADIFKSKSEIKVAENRVKELQYTIDMTTDNIKVQIENALQEYELAVKKFEVYSKTEEQTLENYRIVKDKYDNGLVDTNDLLEADIEQLQSTINLTYIKADITQKFYELLAAKGQLTNKFQIK